MSVDTSSDSSLDDSTAGNISAPSLQSNLQADILGLSPALSSAPPSVNISDVASDQNISDQEDTASDHDDPNSDHCTNSDHDGNHVDPPIDDWHPFLSRVHCQLVLLYHGSHRRNLDLITFRAYLQVLKVRAFIY